MLAAAAAWDVLAGELSSAAAGYGSVIAELTSGQWLGPASMAMAKAAAPYVAWLHATAVQAERTAAQAKETAAAYELAFAMTVPPPVVAANRSLLLTLVATNFFGQNTPAIASTEAHYAEMWIQDATAMYGYAGSSAAASKLTPFTQPQSTTNPAGLAAQSGAVIHGASTAAGNQQTTLSQLISTMPTALQQLAAPAASSNLPSPSTALSVGLSATKFVNGTVSSSSAATSGRGIFIANERLAFQAARDVGSPLRPTGVLASAAPFRLGGSAVSAGMGRASPIGSLSVPPNWAVAAPEMRPVALAIPDSNAAAASGDGGAPVPGSAFSQATLGMLSRHGFDVRHPKSRPIIVRSPAAG
jgi:PPE-repeat protein